ncbi:hypothetical protein TrVE_jg12306 [Triparma verrucosa]|uniref:Uncharacterized protein n=1 Tax=Triparma verrucosa TaxID=1606542 RepID=A0A9W7BIS9_9STRA|nr:hypothetical protein TrVE_jg12306 [Triparma verrucosa]
MSTVSDSTSHPNPSRRPFCTLPPSCLSKCLPPCLALCLPTPIPDIVQTYIDSNYDTQKIASNLTFFPPSIPPYSGTYTSTSNKSISPLRLLKLHTLLPSSPSTSYPSSSPLQTFYTTHLSIPISLTFLTSTSPKSVTILSHGNASDIGTMLHRSESIAENTGSVVVCYDYKGYGESEEDKTTEWETYETIFSIYTTFLPLLPSLLSRYVTLSEDYNVYLYGQSVGSGPSVWLASGGGRGNNGGCEDGPLSLCLRTLCLNYFCCRPLPPPPSSGWRLTPSPIKIKGVILHSPFLSGMRVLTNNRILGCLDIYGNLYRVKYVDAEVFVIHGVEDEDVKVEQGERLRDVSGGEIWRVEGRGHNDVMEGNEGEFGRRMKEFYDRGGGEIMEMEMERGGEEEGTKGKGGKEKEERTVNTEANSI